MYELSTHQSQWSQWGSIQLCELGRKCQLSRGSRYPGSTVLKHVWMRIESCIIHSMLQFPPVESHNAQGIHTFVWQLVDWRTRHQDGSPSECEQLTLVHPTVQSPALAWSNGQGVQLDSGCWCVEHDSEQFCSSHDGSGEGDVGDSDPGIKRLCSFTVDVMSMT